MKKLLIIILLSFNINAHADVFDDIGNFMADNKALTAVLSVTALSAMKLPISSNTSACAFILNDSNVIINSFFIFKYQVTLSYLLQYLPNQP